MSRIKLLSYLASSLLFFTGCRDKEQEAVPEDKGSELTLTMSREQFEKSNLRLGQMEERSFPQTVQATGMIDVPPQNKAVVSAFMGGYIRETPLLVGDRVKKGQSLVILENPEFITLQQNYLEAAEQLNYLRSDYERQKQLVAENISSRKNFLKAESEFRGKRAQYNALKEKLIMLNFSIPSVEEGNIRSSATIFSPISGSITKMNVSKGMYVSPSDEILEITDNDHIHLELKVFEKDIMKLSNGQRILFSIPEASAKYFEAEVYLIGAHIEKNRTVKVHAHLKEEDHHRFLTGMFVEAEVITSEALQLALPDEALVEIDEWHYALKLVSDTSGGYVFEKVRLDIGERYQGYTAILSPEPDKDSKYLIKGAFALLTNGF